jgi:tRNA-splicing ligase RtcB
MKAKQITKLGVPAGKPTKIALQTAGPAMSTGLDKKQFREAIKKVVEDPEAFLKDPIYARLARALLDVDHPAHTFTPREVPAPWKQWGEDLDVNSIEQLENACQLPVSVKGALMPDAHLGYGLPIGGVLATENAVIPYAVGVDIACRMKLTVLDMPPKALESHRDKLVNAIETETRFGIGAQFRGKYREHDVLDEDWKVTNVTRNVRDKARVQLGTSGSGNHFVEFGIFTVDEKGAKELGLTEAGQHLALLSHSGSRGPGAAVAGYYSRLAMSLHPGLPKQLQHLAWLDLDSEAGQEYWAAMNLMGKFAHANHDCIHRAVIKNLGAKAIAGVENHHNFAWKETHEVDGEQRELIVHRKGSTPAGEGVLGVIPGSMASPCYVVRGLGNADSMNSAAHGAGRVMSRTQAKKTFNWNSTKAYLAKHEVTLLSAGLDEVPQVYKDIDQVMAAQKDLVETVARFDPKMVKMAQAGERPED